MERAVPVLPINDLKAAREFYIALGFDVAWEWSAPDGSSGMIGLKRGTIAITLDSPMTGHGRNACVSLEVEDADAYYDEWNASITIPHPPRNEAWGARTFGVQDPSDNTIFVIGPVK